MRDLVGNYLPSLKLKIRGVTLGWDGRPHLCFDNGNILFGDADKRLFPEYFKNGEWPTDPETGEKLPITGS